MYVAQELRLCADCALFAANGDTTGIDCLKRETEVINGVVSLGPHLVVSSDETEEAHRKCDACGEDSWGTYRNACILAEGEESELPW